MRNRCQKRTVGFGEDPVERDLPRSVAQRSGAIECDDTGKRQIEAEVETGARQFKGAAETVQHSAQIAVTFIAKHVERVLVGLSSVDDDRQLQFAREPYLRPKHRLLDVARRVI